jgi:hypothetical protein
MPLLSGAGSWCIGGGEPGKSRQRPVGSGLLGEGDRDAAATMPQKCRWGRICPHPSAQGPQRPGKLGSLWASGDHWIVMRCEGVAVGCSSGAADVAKLALVGEAHWGSSWL